MIRRWLALTYYLYALRLAALSHFYFNRLYFQAALERGTLILVGWAFMSTRLFLERMYARTFSGCLLGKNAWATSAHPTLPKAFCKNRNRMMPLPTRGNGHAPRRLRRVGIYAHAVVLRADVCPSVFRLPLFTDAERVGNECPPYLAENVLQKTETE